MVRLKVSNLTKLIPSVCDFNSTMVRLKVLLAMQLPVLVTNFNSTMVRLKEVHVCHRDFLAFISIPLWYD